jgi:sec-independent protein translocase protein TatA
MWAPGMGELIIILFIVLVIFGAGKLPQVGRSLGSAISEFKSSVAGKDEEEEKSAKSETTETKKPAAE